MAADRLYFNSAYHRDIFFETLPKMLKHFYDHNELGSVEPLRERASVLPVGLDLSRFDAHRHESADDEAAGPLILWNHRWEADKNPTPFLRALEVLAGEGIPFRVALVGENPRHSAPKFATARQRLGERVVAYGYVERFADYARLLWEADLVVSSARQEFFGIAVLEAMYCECVPLLPHRLNYPYLIPAGFGEGCLYADDGALVDALRRHLIERPAVDTEALRERVSQYDWSVVAPLYDAALSRLVQAPPGPLVW